MAQNLGGKKAFMQMVEESNKEARKPKKGFAGPSPVEHMVPGENKKKRK